ncbi:hypothetical protein [Ralstonia pseudosolanacearum]|uniref:hypothetical protein n=1 Tax=Ralstonia pseudosolanacearum TaxID=1310165 RepID=UPI0012681C79|nr:hypothetical protein [Ralstonia pseudosolanacearum]MDO3528730.1 hypothetical protein [Ralstonia pseudosolanacearum]MDO3533800.1 hypothetical protein [Ralstonia pseudosolanacearum]MDO3579096.1 hypothetical protein [Ralstonia pseudosolanacearum]MDO3588768.1 hypothetical protein [Ralstonia pseudosolanacearum]
MEQQAYQAWSLRNTFRTAAREEMADQEAAAQLNATRPHMTWAETVKNIQANILEMTCGTKLLVRRSDPIPRLINHLVLNRRGRNDEI